MDIFGIFLGGSLVFWGAGEGFRGCWGFGFGGLGVAGCGELRAKAGRREIN